MAWKNPSDFVASIQRLPRLEYDNVMLGTGDEGDGKSESLAKIMKNVDPTFGPDRIWPRWDDYKECCQDLKPGQAAIWDEVRLSKFRQGSTLSEEVRTWLQESRGLRLHQCFIMPHWEVLDPSLIPLRVRYNLHFPKRGWYKIRKPLRIRDHEGEPTMDWRWYTVTQFPITKPKGPMIQEYRRRKKMHMRGHTLRYRDLHEPPEEAVRDLGYELADFSPRRADAIWDSWDERPGA